MMKVINGLIIVTIIGVLFLTSCFLRTDIKDETAVLKDIQGTWVGYSQESGLLIQYKLQISDKSFKAWLQTNHTNDEPNWSNQPDESGTFNLSPVQSYTNTFGKYRNINFYKEDGGYGNNSLLARTFSNMILYEDGRGLIVFGWSSMTKR